MPAQIQNNEKQIYEVISGILTDISDLIFIIDDRLKVIGATESCTKLFGVNTEQMTGQPLTNFKAEYWNQNNFQKAIKAIQSGKTTVLDIEIEIDLDDKFKRLVPINLHRIPFKNDIGPITIITLKKLLHPDYLIHIDKHHAEKMAYFSIEYAPDAVFWTNQNAKFIYVNEQACHSLGYTRNELLELYLWDIDPFFPRDNWLETWNALRSSQNINTERVQSIHRRKDGTEFPIEAASRHIILGEDEFHVAFVRDISAYQHAEVEKADLEMQLYQAQKMETVGRLAGGIAHDFNNMLSVILGYIEMLQNRLSHDPQSSEDLIQMEKAANHSKEITRQLLAFSRKQIIAPKPLNINSLIENTEKTLIHLIGENITFEFNPCPNVWMINFDPAQLNQIFINLSVNARDAMPHGGKLLISTVNVHADEAYLRQHVELDGGDYVLLTISDNGVGMDRNTLSYIFEPFFTTKNVDQGTGLGLATVYGIMMQNNGFITVQSEPNIGTTFNLYFPKFEKYTEEKNEEPTQNARSNPVTGTILLVEDDDMLRQMTSIMLQEIGFKVIPADGPMNAIKIFKNNNSKIDLLMTDVVMPDMSGIELKEEINKEDPSVRTLYMSGYASNVVVDYGILEDGVNFIQKPFSMKNLNKQIREILGLD
ncbi:MAG: PAS domain-containing protein [Calditrichaceae bacterium]|nr:PAS domain-containing protein [Calditrichaceae bacterium]